jgi:cytochrome c553
MPDVVAHGRRPDVRACGFCHLPNGQGRPENSSLAGLPAAYIEQQMADFRAGRRKSSEPRMGPPALMLTIGQAATAEESAAAAAYFASFPYKKWIRVVEQNTVPRTRVQGGMLVPAEGGGTEPIGQRIIEMPEDLERTELRDSASGFVAYVPEGAVKRGQELVTTGGNGRSVACGTCHGADLKGLGPVPPIAGRSPSYTVRQLWDMKTGSRHGLWSPLMKAAVEKLTLEDLVAIAAYTSSREP